jgi:hypothetical protein
MQTEEGCYGGCVGKGVRRWEERAAATTGRDMSTPADGHTFPKGRVSRCPVLSWRRGRGEPRKEQDEGVSRLGPLT